jgi:Bacteriocin-protection, YdeI or OmpD-Associated
VLEPDGNCGHWMRVDDTLQHAAGIGAGDTAALGIEVTKDWPEPGVPQDLAAALAAAPQKIQNLWHEITPMARWEWVRWVNATKNLDTRRPRPVEERQARRASRRPPLIGDPASRARDPACGGSPPPAQQHNCACRVADRISQLDIGELACPSWPQKVELTPPRCGPPAHMMEALGQIRSRRYG